MRSSRLLITVLVILVFSFAPVRAAWVLDGTPVATAPDNQFGSGIASDGAGGAIIVWQDHRLGSPDIYAQRIDASGTPLWVAVAISGTAP
jgi:hypothetical protein